jgi:hypothetical protein
MPVWCRSGINAPAFLLLPLHIKGLPFGLIYADKTKLGDIELGDKELSLLRTFSQSGRACVQAGFVSGLRAACIGTVG